MDASKIKMLVMDVDGTLTDGKIYMGPDGEAVKAFDVKDGYAIARMLPEMGIEPVVITGRESAIVTRRCEELGIRRVYQGAINKLDVLSGMLMASESSLSEVLYIGDDLNDLECMQAVKECGGMTGCPADAVREIADIADCIAEKSGGAGAVREIVEVIGDFRLRGPICE